MKELDVLTKIREQTRFELEEMELAKENGFLGMVAHMLSRDVNAEFWSDDELIEHFDYRYNHFTKRLKNLERDTRYEHLILP